MQPHLKSICCALALACVATVSLAATSPTKDIVLDRVAAPLRAAPAVHAGQASSAAAVQVGVQVGDAMAVSVLLESPNGTLTPKSTDTLFHTGDRFRVKLLASRDGKISFYNTNPLGVLSPKPVWSGQVKAGQETISPRLRLDGHSGVDYLHVVLEPKQEPQLFDWLGKWLGSKPDSSQPASKDISLDVQNTATGTYMLNNTGTGLVATVRVVHNVR